MAKKPKIETPVAPVKPSKKTKDAIAFFQDKKSPIDMLENTGGRKLQLSPMAGRTSLNDRFFNWFNGKGEYISLAIMTALFTAVAYWMIKQ